MHITVPDGAEVVEDGLSVVVWLGGVFPVTGDTDVEGVGEGLGLGEGLGVGLPVVRGLELEPDVEAGVGFCVEPGLGPAVGPSVGL